MILNQTFGLCLNLILAILSFLVPKEKNRLLFGARRGGNFYGNPKFFFMYLLNNKNPFKCSWITSDKTLFLRLKEKIPVVYLYSWEGFSCILRSEFLIFDSYPLGISYGFILPGKFYKVSFDLMPDDQIIKAGQQIGLIIFSSDKEFTLHPKAGTELTVDLDGTTLTLPVVGDVDTFNKALGN